jgi:hypothetical protein
MGRRAFLFLVVPTSLAVNAKQKSSVPPPTHDEFISAQRVNRFELTGGMTSQNLARNWKIMPVFDLCRQLFMGLARGIRFPTGRSHLPF